MTFKIERQPVIQAGDLYIDPQRYIVKLSETEIKLDPKEFDVLYFLAQYPNWVLSAGQIYEAVWKENMVKSGEVIVYNVICKIRKKLKRPEIIENVRGRGYRFVG